MTNAKLTEIVFDRKYFPLSPHTKHYEAHVTIGSPANILIHADGDLRLLQKFSDTLKPAYCAELPGLKHGNYEMFVTMAGEDDDPEIIFQIRSKKTANVIASKEMFQLDFLNNFNEAYDEWSTGQIALGNAPPNERIRLFQTGWSVDYLKSEVFGGMIEGSREFWERMHKDLAVALIPVNLKIKLAAQGCERSIVQIEPRHDLH